jgi:hypothetical protein
LSEIATPGGIIKLLKSSVGYTKLSEQIA